MKHLFLPNKFEKNRSPLLRHKALFGYVLFIIALLFNINAFVLKFPMVLGYADNINIQDLLNYTNERRKDNGVKPLVLNAQLSKAAEAKAKHMFENNYWAHTSPDGTEPWDFIISAGYDYLYAGENLAVDFSNSKNVVDAWYQSPTHKDNLINSKYNEIGFAVVNGELEGRKTTLIVQMFGYPRVVSKNINVDGPSSSSQSSKVSVIEQIPEPISGPTSQISPSMPNIDIDEPIIILENEEPKEELPLNEPIVENIIDRQEFVGGTVLSSSEVFNITRYLAIIMGLFLSIIFAIDGYYVKQMGVLRLSGHTFLHISLLILAVVAIWYTHTGLVL